MIFQRCWGINCGVSFKTYSKCVNAWMYIVQNYSSIKTISPRTRKVLLVKQQSAMRDHSYDQDHRIFFDDFKILATAQDPFDLSLKANLLIHKYKPELNIKTQPMNSNNF